MRSEAWKLRNFRQKWFAGETISVGIGQGAVAVTPMQLMRAISAVSMGGKLVVPHVADPAGLPPGYLEVNHSTDVKDIPFDPNGWNVITGDGASAAAGRHGADGAYSWDRHRWEDRFSSGVSLATRANTRTTIFGRGWFVGFTPRRNPDVIVCALFEGGEHGRLAARLATQVIKAYVDKQRRQPIKVVDDPGKDGKAEMGALWTSPDADGDGERLQGGRFVLNVPKKLPPLATAAPGLQ